MRIGFDGKRALWNHTGLGNYSRTLINCMGKYHPENNYFLFVPKIEGSNFLHKIIEPAIIKNTSLFPNALWRSYGIYKAINEQKIDIYHGLSNELPYSINKTAARKVVTIHDLIFLRYPKLYKPLDAFIYNKKFKFACNTADVIIAISEQTKRDIIHYYNIPQEKIKVVYQSAAPIFSEAITNNQINKVKSKYNLPSKFILSVGTIEERKNTLLLLKALPEIKENIDLVLIGKPTKYKALLEEHINKLGINNRVHFLEYVSYEDLPACYYLANVFAYPSKFEGFGIPIIEALKIGTPVVACTGSCLEEAGGPNSKYVQPNDHFALAKTINSIIENKQLATEMTTLGKEFVKQFDPAIIAQNLQNIYSELLAVKQ